MLHLSVSASGRESLFNFPRFVISSLETLNELRTIREKSDEMKENEVSAIKELCKPEEHDCAEQENAYDRISINF